MVKAKYFLAVVDSGTVTAAAERLGITQPALSRQLRRFEKELDLELFVRAGSSLALSDAAHALIPTCRRLLAESARAGQAVEALRAGSVPALRVAATPTTISTLLAPFIEAAGSTIPLLTTTPVMHYDVFDALEGTADVVIATIPPGNDVVSLPLGTIPVRAWVPPTHPLALECAGSTSVEVERLLQENVALPSRRSVSRGVVDSFVGTAGYALGSHVECDDTATLCALARAGRAVALMTELQPVRLVGFDVVDGERALAGVPLVAAWSPGHYAGEEIAQIAQRFRSFIEGSLR
ncbi:LysR family transcriptional regulator [Corynebacterium sp. HMSC072D12]|uniref:LysR family transcriptional regulator n=1 Tax=Corynebacterium sp. HMSC072D12 TaxID=1739447 RepID=UPI000AC092A4|nr:LysR family transcriptional regulator [Corynebacterium sp. HMSC072D12]